MAVGPGKYDDWCTMVREGTSAEAVLVAIIRGEKGSGFSIQCSDQRQLLGLADILEEMATKIRKDGHDLEN